MTSLLTQHHEVLIEARSLCVSYAGKPAVENVTFGVPAGSVTAFLGRNGSGKTSTIRACLGLIHAASGGASLLGREVRFGDVTARHGVAYVPERPALPERRLVADVMGLAAALTPGWDAGEAARLAERLRIDAGARIGTLSKGQRARVALLLALAHRPRLLVLDEPTGGLDPVVRRLFVDEVLRLATEEGRAVLFSTHIVSEIEDVADRVLLLSKGRVAFEGSVEEAVGEGTDGLEAWFVARTQDEA